MTPELQEFVDHARAFEQSMRDAQDTLARSVVTGRSADGTVTMVVSGLGKLQAVRVDPAVFDQRDPEALQDAIAQAVRAAAESAGALAEQKLGPVEITLH
ncbi:YbaB/EbfC family nucleoid-associated protein [Micromonospora sp. HNM0581]|uniref:YbaB/EbfC family nucleoid-associated protein n=1 Tax=Micromonospora sp. HNM0581 TaxID=2716341 RepID=UPI00146C9011|nr:YbaB/EbfC family nucleoid-associated protein [Micromonospora sp. HNM0581]